MIKYGEEPPGETVSENVSPQMIAEIRPRDYYYLHGPSTGRSRV